MTADPADLLMNVDAAPDRLSFFDGQRLAARDWRTEQAFHVAQRQALNRALYTAGIVCGLEVGKDPADPTGVLVSPGLAFDARGREIVVAGPGKVQVPVAGIASTTPGVVFGNLLAVGCIDVQDAFVDDRGAASCASRRGCGTPTRIVGTTVFETLGRWPAADEGRVVLAQVELDAGGQVVRVIPGVRRYAMASPPAGMHPLSLAGEKDVDHLNPKTLVFHVMDGEPSVATLYLRGRAFTSLHYSELGRHTHVITLPSLSLKLDHTHDLKGTMKTKTDGEHRHSFWWDNGNPGAFDMNETNTAHWAFFPTTGIVISKGGNNVTLPDPIIVSGAHEHALEDLTVEPLAEVLVAPVSGTDAIAGADIAARTGPPPPPAFQSMKDLKVFLDAKDVTDLVCGQLEARPGDAGLWRVEAGPGDIRLNGATLSLAPGTGEIDLLKLGVPLKQGEHTLVFKVVDPGSGGNLQYNLYAG